MTGRPLGVSKLALSWLSTEVGFVSAFPEKAM